MNMMANEIKLRVLQCIMLQGFIRPKHLYRSLAHKDINVVNVTERQFYKDLAYMENEGYIQRKMKGRALYYSITDKGLAEKTRIQDMMRKMLNLFGMLKERNEIERNILCLLDEECEKKGNNTVRWLLEISGAMGKKK